MQVGLYKHSAGLKGRGKEMSKRRCVSAKISMGFWADNEKSKMQKLNSTEFAFGIRHLNAQNPRDLEQLWRHKHA